MNSNLNEEEGSQESSSDKSQEKQIEVKEDSGSKTEKKARSCRVRKATKSQKKNKHYWKTEDSILKAFFQTRSKQTVKKLTKRAKISRSTFYRHHENQYAIMPDLERKTVAEFGREMGKFTRAHGVQTRMLVYRLLNFVRKNGREFGMIVRRGDERTLEAMIDDLLPQIARANHIPTECEALVRVYQKEITGVIETWVMNNFHPGELKVLKDIMYLTRTARQRLIALEN